MSESVRATTMATLAGIIAISSLYLDRPAPALLAIAALSVIIIIATWQPVIMLALVTATLPLFHQPVQIGNTVLAPSELLLAAALFGTMARFTYPANGQLETSWEGYKSKFGALIAVMSSRFSLVMIASMSVAVIVGFILTISIGDRDVQAAGLREWRWTLVEPLLFVALLIWHDREPQTRMFIGAAFVVGGLLTALWGLTNAISGVGVSAGGVTRSSGPFPHPNAFALYLLRPVVLSAVFLLVTRSTRIAAWLACGVGVVALGTSFSRSAALGVIVGLILVWPWLSYGLRIVVVSCATIVGAALILFAGGRTIGSEGQDSLALRLDIWRSGLAMVRDSPIFGYGPDQFLYTYTPRYIAPGSWAERFTAHAHNLLIDFWIRLGIIGAVFVALSVAVILRAVWQVRSGERAMGHNALSVAAVITLAAAMAQGLVDNGYFVHDLAMSAWLLAWLAFSERSQR